MPARPRPAPLLALAVVLAGLPALAGCDTTNPGGNLALVEGTYTLAELSFDPATTDLSTANVARSLDLAATRLDIFGGGGNTLLLVQRLNGTRRRIDLRTRASRERVTFEAVTRDDEAFLAGLLLPATFTLGYTGERPNVLEASLRLTGVDLEAFDPDRYQDQRSNAGQLSIRFERAGRLLAP